jgi:hypothetical protein
MRSGLVANERHELTLFEGGGAYSPWIFNIHVGTVDIDNNNLGHWRLQTVIT